MVLLFYNRPSVADGFFYGVRYDFIFGCEQSQLCGRRDGDGISGDVQRFIRVPATS